MMKKILEKLFEEMDLNIVFLKNVMMETLTLLMMAVFQIVE